MIDLQMFVYFSAFLKHIDCFCIHPYCENTASYINSNQIFIFYTMPNKTALDKTSDIQKELCN